MNTIAGKFIRYQRASRSAATRPAHDSRGLALLIATQAVDWFFWELINQEDEHYPCRFYDADWLIEDLQIAIENYIPDSTMDRKFYPITEAFYGALPIDYDAQPLNIQELDRIMLGIDVCRRLAKAIRTDRRYCAIRSDYAAEIADRIFHDRQLSYLIAEYVSRSLRSARKRSQRIRWSSNVKRIVFSRDRGKCANCHCDIAIELLATAHLDHIISISNGGSNDPLNLQLLCSLCNLKKGAKSTNVASSVPKYHPAQRDARKNQQLATKPKKRTLG